jgi:molybdenum cofactor cytidylyltransferase
VKSHRAVNFQVEKIISPSDMLRKARVDDRSFSAACPSLTVVVLAAGLSLRLRTSKALVRIHGMSLLKRTVGLLAAGSKWPIVVVAPPNAARYRAEIANRPAKMLGHRARAEGLASSIQRGLRACKYSSAVLLLPVDLVNLTGRDVRRLIHRWQGHRRRVVGRDIGAKPGSPLILPKWLYPLRAKVFGDRGFRDALRDLDGGAVCLVAMPSAEIDIDTGSDLRRARRSFRGMSIS